MVMMNNSTPLNTNNSSTQEGVGSMEETRRHSKRKLTCDDDSYAAKRFKQSKEICQTLQLQQQDRFISSFTLMPIDLHFVIFSYLSTRELLNNTCLINQHFHQLICRQGSQLWEKRCFELRDGIREGPSWNSMMQFFKDCHVGNFFVTNPDLLLKFISQHSLYIKSLSVTILWGMLDIQQVDLASLCFPQLHTLCWQFIDHVMGERVPTSEQVLASLVSGTTSLTQLFVREGGLIFVGSLFDQLLNQNHLKVLKLESAQFNEDQLIKLMTQHKLESFSFTDCASISSDTWSKLSKLPNIKYLKQLKYSCAPELNSRSLAPIDHLNLESLHFAYVKSYNIILPFLRASQNTLKSLTIQQQSVNRFELDSNQIPTLPNLSCLSLCLVQSSLARKFFERCSDSLEHLSFIQYTDFSGPPPESEPKFSLQFPKLKHIEGDIHSSLALNLLSATTNTKLDTIAIRWHSHYLGLEEESLPQWQEALSKFTSLQHLLGDSVLLHALPEAVLPSIKTLYIQEAPGERFELNEALLNKLLQCTSCVSVVVAATEITAPYTITRLMRELPHLEALNLKKACHANDHVQESIEDRQYLIRKFKVDCSKLPVSEVDKLLSNMPNLEYLDICLTYSPNVLQALIRALNQAKQFRCLNVRFISAAQEAMDNIPSNYHLPCLKRLSHLHLSFQDSIPMNHLTLICLGIGLRCKDTDQFFVKLKRRGISEIRALDHEAHEKTILASMLKTYELLEGLSESEREELIDSSNQHIEDAPACIVKLFETVTEPSFGDLRGFF